MRPAPSPTDPRPNAPKGIHWAKQKITPIKKENVLAAMSARSPTTTLEPFLGAYRIVWDSESNYDPRDVLFDDAGTDRDPDDGLIILTRPQRAQAWPKEPAPSSSVVLRFCDTFLGTIRTASVIKPSPRPAPVADTLPAPFSSPSSSPLSSSPPSMYASSSRSPSSVRTGTSRSTATDEDDGTGRFWRFDWDPSFPRLGFRFEGMDLTAPHGHALSFSRIRDDRGWPFLVVDLRPTGFGSARGDGDMRVRCARKRDADSAERRSSMLWVRGRDECGDRPGTGGEPRPYITVVAKRVPDRYVREGLSDAERARLGMVELDDLHGDFPFE
ncbi:hypothetical protein C8Q77DRAFT_1157441 [Trametes polyzona]|nr:hypothetical protein C8Q77DRAFT_1157441 [Trametes polyzona]